MSKVSTSAEQLTRNNSKNNAAYQKIQKLFPDYLFCELFNFSLKIGMQLGNSVDHSYLDGENA